jgi:ketosteroid isomerase-like protein
MPGDNVEVVRQFYASLEGENLVPRMREAVDRLGPDPQTEAVVAFWAEDPAWQHVHPDVEWDFSGTGGTPAARGVKEVGALWAEWLEVWESYLFRPTEYRDLGDWVLVETEARAQGARGRGGIPVEMRVFELYRVRDGKIVVYRSFFSEQEALEAAGLTE